MGTNETPPFIWSLKTSCIYQARAALGGLALCPMLPGWFFFGIFEARLEQGSGELPNRSGPPVDQHIMQLTKSCLHIAFLHSRPGSNVICETLQRRCRTLLLICDFTDLSLLKYWNFRKIRLFPKVVVCLVNRYSWQKLRSFLQKMFRT